MCRTKESNEVGITAIKICGLQSVEVIAAIRHLPIDYIGLMFAKSKRQVTAAQAKRIIDSMRGAAADKPPALAAGVFVNPQRDELATVVREAALDIVQLHGQEAPEFCRWVKDELAVRVFKVFSVSGSKSAADVEKQLEPYLGAVDAILLDTYDPVIGGGTGQTFAWDCIPMYQRWTSNHGLPLFIAGGLNADNVDRLIQDYRPDGVDVSSGVETNGIKDIQKITNFVERVRNHG
jgi:phosphoribosylanthranilate isomerase